MKKRSLRELAEKVMPLELEAPLKKNGYRVHILALGDVGATLLLGLKTMGKGIIDTIGIYDMNPDVVSRYEMEMNQIGEAFTEEVLPRVVPLKAETLFQCDMFLFCASKQVPAIGVRGDVRMMQFEENRKIAARYAELAARSGYQGIFAVVSDPVDPLCKAVLLASGLNPAQVRGYGLGVMHMRAEYFAKKDARFVSYLEEGRAFGPHGSDLVIANSITDYDDVISRELTALAVSANLRIRDLGFKPYIAPAFSSGVFSILKTLRQEWHYSSVYFGAGSQGAFLGVKNRILNRRIQFEDILLPEELYQRIALAYRNLCDII